MTLSSETTTCCSAHAQANQAQPNPSQADPETWVDSYGEALFRYAAAKVSDLSVVEDLVQETLLNALRQRQNFRGEACVQTWLISILRRKIADHYRRSIRENGLSSEETKATASVESSETQSNISATKSPEDLAQDAEFWGLVTECVSSMPEHLASAFKLRTLAGHDHREVCKSEGISEKNLSVRLYRARQMIRSCLEKLWGGPEN